MNKREWVIGVVVIVIVAGIGLLVHSLQAPTAPVSPLPEFSAQQAIEVSEPFSIQGGPLSYRFATEAECEKEREMKRYTEEKTIVVICIDDYELREEIEHTLKWLNHHPENWWIYPSAYELMFLPEVN